MDKQLACATFATLIPVLLIAGTFSSDWDYSARWFRSVAWVVSILCFIGEMAAIIGTASPHPTTTHVLIAMFGACAAVAAPFAGFWLRLKAEKRSPGQRAGADDREPGSGNGPRLEL